MPRIALISNTTGWRGFVWRRMRLLAPLCAAGLLPPPLLALMPAESAGSIAWLLDLAAHWQWVFAPGLALTAGVATLVDRRWALLLPALALPWLSASPHLPSTAAAGPATFSIATANVHMDNQDVRPLAQWLAREQVDVVVVLEVSPAYAKGLQTLDAYPHRHVVAQDDPFGIAVLSRHPLLKAATVRDAEGIAHIEALVAWQGRQVAVIAVHPMPPISAHYAAVRNAKLSAWARAAAASALPTLVAGDLNATPWSIAFNGLDALGLRRATGVAPTWPATLRGVTGIPIDHVLANRHWLRIGSARGPDLGSDHLPVLARLQLADRLLVTKTDLAPDAIERLTAPLRALNPSAPILSVRDGVAAVDAVMPARDPDETARTRRWLAFDTHAGASADPNRHRDGIEALCLTVTAPIDWLRLQGWLEQLRAVYGAQLLRAKGVFNLAGEAQPVVVHGVHHVFHPAVRLAAWPDGERTSKLVLILCAAPVAEIRASFAAHVAAPAD